MKWTGITMMLFFGHLSLASYSQSVTLRLEKASLKQVISAIGEQSGYTFLYDQKYLKQAKPVTLNVRDKPVMDVIEQVFANQPFVYSVVDRMITIRPKPRATARETLPSRPAVQDRYVKGRVTDSVGSALPGASVTVKGTTKGTRTDAEGYFALEDVDDGAILVISFLGSVTQEVPVSRGDMRIVLQADLGELEEVVVVGFGTQKKVNLTGAVSHVGKEVLENRPVANIGQALQGVIPNLNIGFDSGAPNETPSFNMRGGTSFAYNEDTKVFETQNANPLVIIDGVESSVGQLNQLNPNDVMDISFIKDASAAAIYGTKAAYGVILVRTKRGDFNQKGQISYAFDASFDKPAAIPDILDAYTLQKAAMDGKRWTGGVPSSSDERRLEMIQKYIDNPVPENTWYQEGNDLSWVANINPFDEMVRNWTPMQKHTLSTSGGGSNVNYYMSLGYQNQEGMFKINTDKFKRYNAMVNVNAKVNKWFNLFAKLSFDQTHYESPYLVGGKGNLWAAMMNEPGKNINMPIKTGPNDPLPDTYTDNILSWISYGARNNSIDRRFSLVASPEFIVVPNTLKIKADVAYLPHSYRLKRYMPKIQQVVDSWNYTVQQAEAAENRAYFDNNNTDTYTANIYVDFKKTFAESHNLSAIAGFFQEQRGFQQLTNTFRGLLSPDIQNPNAAEDPSLHTVNTDAYLFRGRALFGRLNYDYKGKYLAEMNIRHDGSSKFTPSERYVTFPSFSAGWRVSEERFMEATRSWLDNFKLRGSWGVLGNQPSSYYPYQPVLGTGKSAYLINGNQVVYMNPPGLVSPYLTFEKAETINFGVDATLFSSRLDVTFDRYRRTTRDILSDGDANYPSFLGATPPYTNSGTLETKGFELAISWRDRFDSGLGYRIGVNLSDYQTKVVRYAGNDQKLITNSGGRELLYDGKEVGEIWGYTVGGILQESDFEKQLPNGSWEFNGPYQHRVTANLYPGYLWYQDMDGDGKVDGGNNLVGDSGDRMVIGNSTPRYRFGVMGNVSYQNFDLDFLFQGVMKRDLWIGNANYWGGGAGSREMYERSWTPDNTDAEFPMYNAPRATNSAYLVDGSYIRLKQAILGYTLPARLIKNIGLEKVRFTVAGFNLFEITEIPGIFDPDQLSSAYPQKRTVSVGAQIVF